MKKWIAGLTAWCAALALFMPEILAVTVEDGRIVYSAERTAAYWTLGVCSAVFVLLVLIWCMRLKKSAKDKEARRAAAQTRK